MSAPLPPITRSVQVSWSQREAFARFTEKFGDWWPHKTHSIGGSHLKRVVLEPKLGGLIYEEHTDGRRFQWGEIIAWDPPRELIFTFHPSLDKSQAQDVRVAFEPDGAGTLLKLESSGWERLGEKSGGTRKCYSAGWAYILNGFAERRTFQMGVMDAMVAVVLGVQRLTGQTQAAQIAKAKGEISSTVSGETS